MKKLLLSLFVSAGLCFYSHAQIVDFTLQDSDNGWHTLFTYLGNDKVVVLNFWSEQNCPPCIAFASTLEGIYTSYGTNTAGVIVLSIEITQKSYVQIDTWRNTNGVSYPAIGGDQGPPSGNGYLAYSYWNSEWSGTLGMIMPQLIVIHPDAGNPGNSTVNWQSPFGGPVVPGDDAAIRTAIDGYTGIQDQNLLDGKISIFPNPATDFVNVQFVNRSSEEVSVNIFNIIGEKINLPIITTANNGVTSNRINTSELANGYYMVQIKTETATKTMRLQIIK